jgi:hypothetical protein
MRINQNYYYYCGSMDPLWIEARLSAPQRINVETLLQNLHQVRA